MIVAVVEDCVCQQIGFGSDDSGFVLVFVGHRHVGRLRSFGPLGLQVSAVAAALVPPDVES